VADITLREAGPSDVEFLKEMLYQAANRPGEAWPPFDECINLERNRRFWMEWPRPADIGVIAEESERLAVGAAWIREFQPQERLSPYDEPGVPELAIAVRDGYRGKRIGDALMDRLIRCASERGLTAISLSTGTFNTAALRLYERHGFREIARRDEAVRMKWTSRSQ
jgi:ribosomal protein S18 acetylase RimI-like enzyme